MQVAFVLFPNLTQLDLTGPLQILHRLPGATIHLAAASREPVPSDCGLSLVPTCTFEEVSKVDLLCIPGGFGVSGAIREPRLMEFVSRAGGQAQYLTSVCTGAFVLGAAGLLKGKRATTHWAYRDLLTKVGAIPVDQRVVKDGPVITGGGVTAGIDFAFTVVEEIAGTEMAERIQVGLEYRPEAREYPNQEHVALRSVQNGYAARIEEFSRELEAL
ncbi:MAG: DJ-1/PfpI family protein [Candidatus Eremiobacteraeota bacterium]|nr:DJ-1/PfpI family protein [Candidatus Eremiobacteraeota bacterium]